MPMNTMLLTRPGPPAISPRDSARAPSTTCSTISAVLMLRVRPAWPVAQNGQAIPQPACDETHIVVRSGVAHQHRLDQRTVEQLPQRLAGGPVVALQVADLGQQRRHQLRDQLVPGRGRQVGHLGRVVDQPARSSGSTAAWPGTRAPRAPSTAVTALRPLRSARCRGGFLARRGSSKTRGREVVIALPLSLAAPLSQIHILDGALRITPPCDRSARAAGPARSGRAPAA